MITMTKWQHLKHAFGIHCWHKVRDWEADFEQERCGAFDPRPLTKKMDMVSLICAQCGLTRNCTWFKWVGL